MPWWAWIVALVAAEATFFLIVIPTSHLQAALAVDGVDYWQHANDLLHHGVFSIAAVPPYYPDLTRTPGYPAFLVVFDWIGGGNISVVQLAQYGIVAATAILAGIIGRRLLGRTTGTLAAVLTATYLPFLGYSMRFMTEVFATAAMTLVILLLLVARRSGRISACAGAGLALAVLTYARPEFLLFGPLAAVVLLPGTRESRRSLRGWTRSLMLLAVFVAALIPWTVRNALVTGGELVPMAAATGNNLLASVDQYNGLISYKITGADWAKVQAQQDAIAPAPANPDARAQVRVDRRLLSAAIRGFRSLSLVNALRTLPRRLAYLWGTGDAPPPGRWYGAIHLLARAQYAVLVILGLIGLIIRRRHLVHDWPLWIAAVYLSVTHLVFPVEGRYTLPARPTLMIYAAVGALGLISAVQPKQMAKGHATALMRQSRKRRVA